MKDLLSLVNCLSSNNGLRVDLQLLTDGIFVPQLTEEFDTFSVQGNILIHNSSRTKTINKITLKFKGCIDRFRSSENTPQKSVIIENEMEIVSSKISIAKGGTALSFEMALPRTLPPSVFSEYFKLNYCMNVMIETENTKIPCSFPTKVYNHHLIPHLDFRLTSYSDSGSIDDVMEYAIDFPKRFFSKDELIPLKVLIQPEHTVQLNYITAKLIQKVALMNHSTQTPIDKNPHIVSLSKETQYFVEKKPIHDLKFYLPVFEKSEKLLLPTLDSNHFEVIHQLQITVNYTVKGKSLVQYLNIKIPIAVTTQLRNSLVELPDYLDISEDTDGMEGCLLNVGELPPIYSI
ncbi:hypothetical protein CONCODRAFT_83027 [Conidiobolus coronatus NRRL 28638]|uniref:Arrestin C-terminal-like domain-containing protein n=1 Tax=Conidiobolus coronatus (strain ATCC 28846 / CBS 209.66 / NRRL 28638) TaxID=796925 RepID=A0A137PH55_CONC2|nr:hypothetical protein CONCODRAFT_83027 [Conidiobolus coronatus NRRL 28638]|eukprot:KXN74312.1 hypothetical protein CONCODRAFT_83027 [Conidiobolus coronatus NRRL 28638]